MREILFRGKIKGSRSEHEELNWAFGNLVKELETNRCFISDIAYFDENTKLSDVILEVDPRTVCQYTGLTDKNGRKIFEGDIVCYGKKMYSVVWLDGIACFDSKPLEDVRYRPCMNEGMMKKSEVIGNIFDNPELTDNKMTGRGGEEQENE